MTSHKKEIQAQITFIHFLMTQNQLEWSVSMSSYWFLLNKKLIDKYKSLIWEYGINLMYMDLMFFLPVQGERKGTEHAISLAFTLQKCIYFWNKCLIMNLEMFCIFYLCSKKCIDTDFVNEMNFAVYSYSIWWFLVVIKVFLLYIL